MFSESKFIQWVQKQDHKGVLVGQDRETGFKKWEIIHQDLLFGTNAELRIVAFTYSSPNAKRRFIADFFKAWTKVMTLDRLDLKSQ